MSSCTAYMHQTLRQSLSVSVRIWEVSLHREKELQLPTFEIEKTDICTEKKLTVISCNQCEVIMEETVNVQTVVQYWEAASRYVS